MILNELLKGNLIEHLEGYNYFRVQVKHCAISVVAQAH